MGGNVVVAIPSFIYIGEFFYSNHGISESLLHCELHSTPRNISPWAR